MPRADLSLPNRRRKPAAESLTSAGFEETGIPERWHVSVFETYLTLLPSLTVAPASSKLNGDDTGGGQSSPPPPSTLFLSRAPHAVLRAGFEETGIPERASLAHLKCAESSSDSVRSCSSKPTWSRA